MLLLQVSEELLFCDSALYSLIMFLPFGTKKHGVQQEPFAPEPAHMPHAVLNTFQSICLTFRRECRTGGRRFTSAAKALAAKSK